MALIVLPQRTLTAGDEIAIDPRAFVWGKVMSVLGRRLAEPGLGSPGLEATEAPSRRIRGIDWAWFASSSPGRLVSLWTLLALASTANVVVFPGDDPRAVSSTLYLSAAPVFIGLAAAWALKLGGSTVPLLSALVSVRLAASVAALAVKFVTAAELAPYVGVLVGLVSLLASILIIWRGFGAGRSRRRRAVAVLFAIGIQEAFGALAGLDGAFWTLSTKVQPLIGRQDASEAAGLPLPEIPDDRLWEAQPALIEGARTGLGARVTGETNVYALAVAGSGAQALFSREAHEALRVASLHFGGESRGGALLSNGAADFMQSPLATRGNISAVLRAVGQRADRKADLLFLYLASHGSRSAELASELPGYRPVEPISAATTAEALREAGVARRVIVISACYSATWIPALANDNTIVITAAAKDRTSFGCDDSRRLTVFGEAFLGSLAPKNISLHDAFEQAKRKISAEERALNETPSLPQVYVGRNMQGLWLGETAAK